MADADNLTHAFLRSHPPEAARLLELAPATEVAELLTRVPTRIGAVVVAEMEPRIAARILRTMSEERALELLTHLGSQPAVAVLRQIEEPVRGRLIAGLPTAAGLTARLLVQFVDDSVGACVDPNALTALSTTSAGEALDRVRSSDVGVRHVVVVDEQRRLTGWVPLDALLRASSQIRLESLMQPPPARLSVNAPLAGARADAGWLAASMLPAVDRGGRFIGLVTREGLDRALGRIHRTREVAEESQSVAVTLVQTYWQSVSGILEALTALLPPARALDANNHER